MFENIPSLKDFIIYFIPGALITYFGLNIITKIFDDQTIMNVECISGNSLLIFISVLLAFLVGFILSQLQIIIYNAVINRKDSLIRKLKSASISDELKLIIAEKYIQNFGLTNTGTAEVLNDSRVLHLCLNYVKSKSNEQTEIFLNRSSNLSSFASASTLPILLGLYNFTFLINFNWNWWRILAFILLAVIVMIITWKITINFRKEWINSVYKQFLIL